MLDVSAFERYDVHIDRDSRRTSQRLFSSPAEMVEVMNQDMLDILTTRNVKITTQGSRKHPIREMLKEGGTYRVERERISRPYSVPKRICGGELEYVSEKFLELSQKDTSHTLCCFLKEIENKRWKHTADMDVGLPVEEYGHVVVVAEPIAKRASENEKYIRSGVLMQGGRGVFLKCTVLEVTENWKTLSCS